MSAPSSNNNLTKAQAVRSSGYPTKVHELPEFKTWFDKEVRRGAKTIPQLRREALELFPHIAGRLPSVKRLYSYAGKYLTETVKVQPYLPQYWESMREYDSYLELVDAAKEAERQYYLYKELDSKPVRSKRVEYWFAQWAKITEAIFDAEMRMGMRDDVIINNHLAIMSHLSQIFQNVSSGATLPSMPSDMESRSIEEIRKRLKVSSDARRKYSPE